MNKIANIRTSSEAMTENLAPDPVDIHVGRRLRLRRTILSMSQEQLAAQIGVSFQQVQKYERGTNRISASRLYDISRVVNVPISFFFQDITDETDASRQNNDAIVVSNLSDDFLSNDPMSRSETLELVRNYWRIAGDNSRKQILELVKALTSSSN